MVTQVRSARAPQRRHVRQAATLLALILLTGCSALDYLDTWGRDTSGDQTDAIFDPDAGIRTPASPTGEATPRAKPAPPKAPKRTTTPSDAPPPPVLDPANIVGLGESDAEKLFGPPHFVIREQPAIRWHYVSKTCTLDLFFFEDIETRARKILAYDVGDAPPGGRQTHRHPEHPGRARARYGRKGKAVEGVCHIHPGGTQ
jgi:hypothetical protein